MATARNIAIVAVIALAVLVLPGGGDAASLVAAILGLIFSGGIVFFAGRMYRENRVSVFSLGDLHRGILYGSLAVAAVAVTGTNRMWETSVGTFAWFVLVGAASWGVVVVIQHVRSY